MSDTLGQFVDKKKTLVAELSGKLGSYTVSVFCAQMGSLSSAQTAYYSFIETASGSPSKTTVIFGEILENKIDPRKGPAVGILSHDLTCEAQKESYNWFGCFAERFHGLSSATMWSVKDRNGGELMALPLRVYEFKHLY